MKCEMENPQKQVKPKNEVSHFPFHLFHFNAVSHFPFHVSHLANPLPRVLLAAPISRNKEYILQDWLQHITGFTYPAYDIFLVDNSPDPAFHQEVWRRGFQCGYYPPQGKRAPDFIADSQNMLRQYFLENDYDYFFSLECDNFPPHNIIELMLSYRADNINIPYFLKQGPATALGVQLSVINYQGWCANKVMAPYEGIGAFDGRVKRYFAPSIGCSLFSKKLMQQLKFRTCRSNPMAFSDSFWHLDSNRIGIKPLVHMGVLCEHRRFTWKYNRSL